MFVPRLVCKFADASEQVAALPSGPPCSQCALKEVHWTGKVVGLANSLHLDSLYWQSHWIGSLVDNLLAHSAGSVLAINRIGRQEADGRVIKTAPEQVQGRHADTAARGDERWEGRMRPASGIRSTRHIPRTVISSVRTLI